MRALMTQMGRLRGDTGGAAAVEFALVLPILAVFVIALIQYGGMIIANQQMHNGVASGALYVMRGGSDATAIHDVSLSAWPNRPSDAGISVAQSCVCAGATSTCSSLCPDQSYPQTFTQITATGTYTGLFGNQAISATQVIRTQ